MVRPGAARRVAPPPGLPPRDRGERNGRARAALEPAHRGGAGTRVDGQDLAELAGRVLADVTGRQGGGAALGLDTRLGAPARPGRLAVGRHRRLRGRRAGRLRTALHLLERNHIGTGALGFHVEYPNLCHTSVTIEAPGLRTSAALAAAPPPPPP